MPELTDAERRLAAAHGIATSYDDWRGGRVEVPATTVRAVLSRLDDDQTAAPPGCLVVVGGVETQIDAGADAQAGSAAWVMTEAGHRVDLSWSEGEITLPGSLPIGYHRLHQTTDDGTTVRFVAVAPARLDLPVELAETRGWGLAIQLYSVRSDASWGVGDLADLGRLAHWAGADLGADFVLVNPLSAAQPVGHLEPSPYLPSSRLFTNPLYLRVEHVAEFAGLPAETRDRILMIKAGLQMVVDGADTIDRDRAWAAKSAALTLLHKHPKSAERADQYARFLAESGDALVGFATWCALSEVHGDDWHEWDAELRHPDSSAVSKFRDDNSDRVDFYSWLQWLLDEQLERAHAAARAAGMRIGVMHDLAVGVHPNGADAWVLQDALMSGVHVGAPPDAFNQRGQDWSQPPWRPDRLAALDYAPYRQLIARLLRHAGAVRIDHVIGLFRLWCVPEDVSPDLGTYLRFDHDALLGLLCLEAVRAGAMIVGEDLGNVAPAARSALVDRGILGTSILWFEADAEGGPLPPQEWRELCLASVTTHDLPPTAGYLTGDHVRLRAALGLLTRSVEEERAADDAERERWLAYLTELGLRSPTAGEEATIAALHRFLGLTPARLVCVSLTDMVGDRRTQNQPGTTDEYPNWRVPLAGPDRLPMTLEQVMSSSRAGRLAAVVRAAVSQAPMP